MDDHRGESGGGILCGQPSSQGGGEIFLPTPLPGRPRGEGRGLTDTDDAEAMKGEKRRRDEPVGTWRVPLLRELPRAFQEEVKGVSSSCTLV